MVGGVSPVRNVPTLAEAVRHYNQGNRAAARQVCERMLADGSSDNDARLLLGILLIEDGHAARGIGLLQEIVAVAPGSVRARHALGKALARVGRAADAVRQLEQVIALAPGNIDAYLDLGGIHLRQNDLAQAEEVLRRALARAPQHPAVLGNLGGLLASHGDAAEAVRLLRRALAIAPGMPTTHYNLAIALKANGDFEGAADQYRAAIARKPDYVDAHHNLGNLLLDCGRVDEAAAAYEAGTLIRRRPGFPSTAGGGKFVKTNPSKLRHDIEQLHYLIARQRIGPEYRKVIADHETALAALPANANGTGSIEIPAEFRERLAPTYNRLVYRPPAPALADGAVNRRLDAATIEADYRRHHPGITFFDDFLAAGALAALRRFCLEATVWFECRYSNGYLGAFLDDGFCCPLLLQIAEELRRRLPGIFAQHTLRKLWAFKYDSRLSGIPVHADFAAVNVNFWVTPDAANLDPAAGGLIVWDKEAPLDWDFAKYNNDQAAMRRFLVASGAKSVNVPHRQNRVVIFNSDLFHETGPLRCRDGYENRRINITMLYGKRGG
jgi:Tfp pilus assembly protein PilF